MSQTFSKAPLVELVAEARWASTSMLQAPGMPVGMTFPGAPDSEEFYMRFGVKAHLKGFQHVERLMPAGFPVPAGNVVYRYKQGVGDHAEQSRTELWQVGPGVFAANATPPYKSWENFEPIVRDGFEALLGSRSSAEKGTPFSVVSLRYIDAFGSSFLEGRSQEDFVKNVLGFEVILPEPVSAQLKQGGTIAANFQITMPVSDSLIMTIALAKNQFAGEEVVMMDTIVRSSGEVPPEIDSIMGVLSEARKVIHNTFMAITEKIHPLMGLKEN